MPYERHPYMRYLIGAIAIALSLRIAWELIQPVLPVLAVLICIGVAVWLVGAYRARW